MYADECNLVTSSNTSVEMEVSNITVISEEKVTLLGIYINNRLNYGNHICEFCKEAGEIFYALTQVFPIFHENKEIKLYWKNYKKCILV